MNFRRSFGILASSLLAMAAVSAQADLWVTGYYPGWESMAVTNIDFSVVTHVIHFSLVPGANGSINTTANSITTSAAAKVVTAAHYAGRKALICVGGASTETYFQAATTSANLGTFVTNIVNFMSSNGYDGVDLDWEPFNSADTQQYTNFVVAMRSALNGFSSHKLFTVAAPAYPEYGDSPTAEFAMLSSVQSQFDQINIMTYDLSGPYEGWVTWFNSPIYDGGYMFPNTTELVPSINAAVSNFMKNGVQSSKLGIGIPFYGYIWTGGPGVTQPRQSWPASNAPTTTGISYAQITNTYFQTNLYHWDNAGQAAYLSVTNAPASNDVFISYDDARACQSKISFARNSHLGGVMIWELAQDYFANQPAGQRTPLTSALKSALATPAISSVQSSNGALLLNFTSAPLGSYTIQATSNLAPASWSNVASNLNGTGSNVQFTDTNAAGKTNQFYRVKTP